MKFCFAYVYVLKFLIQSELFSQIKKNLIEANTGLKEEKRQK